MNVIDRHITGAIDQGKTSLERNAASEKVVIELAVDLRHDPNALIWEAYCPNSEVLSALVALTEAGG